MQSSVSLYSYRYDELKTYVSAALFVVGNILLPQLFHLIPKGGMMWLPIYFFTLIAAYKYGWRTGLLTAVFSPLCNSLLFGMPLPTALPVIVVKSVLLALCAAFCAHRFHKVSIALLILVVLTYQILGSTFEWIWTGSLTAALQDFRLGLPGMLLQTFGGYLTIRYVLKK